jgi:histidine ammonia-lyase
MFFRETLMPPTRTPARLHSPFAPLTLPALLDIARGGAGMEPIRPGQSARLERSAAWVAAAVEQIAAGDAEPIPYYGINTGFGDNAGRAAFRRAEDAERLSRNLLLSHTTGVGEPLPEDVVRAALAIRIASLSRGYSGVRPRLINGLIEMLNRRVYPVVPAQGSLGASGDLAPLAHLVLPLSAPLPGEDPDRPGTTGYCFLDGRRVTGAEAMRAAGIDPVRLGAKEGVALINGTAISAAIGALALHDARQVMAAAHLAAAMSADALRGFRDAFLPYANRLRSAYQAVAAATILHHLRGSTLIRGAAAVDLPATEGPPQDPYCLRCAPAVYGAALRALEHIEAALADELGAVTDNPLIFTDDDPDSPDYLPRHTKMISGGNFHGEPVAFALDYLGIVMADVAGIAERRIFTLTDPRLNRGLPPFLIDEAPEHAGLNSGLMLTQYTAAALVSENKTLAHPASVDSIPSSANREDHVSMSTLAARKAAQIVTNARRVLALELLCASQALSLRLAHMPGARPGEGTAHALATIRGLAIGPGRGLDVISEDVPLGPHIAAIDAAIRDASAFAGL